VASDCLLALFEVGGLRWQEDEIIRFCRKFVSKALVKFSYKREISECEFLVLDKDGVVIKEFLPAHTVLPTQELHVDASMAMRSYNMLPDVDKRVLAILIDGGTPIDICQEMGLEPWAAIEALKTARSNARRVGNWDE